MLPCAGIVESKNLKSCCSYLGFCRIDQYSYLAIGKLYIDSLAALLLLYLWQSSCSRCVCVCVCACGRYSFWAKLWDLYYKHTLAIIISNHILSNNLEINIVDYNFVCGHVLLVNKHSTFFNISIIFNICPFFNWFSGICLAVVGVFFSQLVNYTLKSEAHEDNSY